MRHGKKAEAETCSRKEEKKKSYKKGERKSHTREYKTGRKEGKVINTKKDEGVNKRGEEKG